jgi:hypothetical protein
MGRVLVLAIVFAFLSAAAAQAGPCKVHGNNGWGNGGYDGINGGSWKGKQSVTKLPNQQR